MNLPLYLRRHLPVVLLAASAAMTLPTPATAAEELCDPAHQDCRAKLLDLIRNEKVGIDVAFWFMEDARYSNELVKKAAAGVPVRVLIDTRANSTYSNEPQVNQLAAAGIPMRRRVANGILHWKMMLFHGQNVVEFSGANYSANAFETDFPYQSYIDEVIYFTDDSSVVNSFRTKYDDLWINTTAYRDYANITGPLTRRYDIFPKDPELNFPPSEGYRSRAVKRYDAETQQIDVVMYRITDDDHANAMIRAARRGVDVRLYTEQEQYRDASRLWHSWNVDRMYMEGQALAAAKAPGSITIRDRAHSGLNHQKTVLLYSQKLSIFGSSNWTSPSNASQEEHNYFTYKTWIFQWLQAQFERKWNNTAPVPETKEFVPLPPDRPKNHLPADGTTAVPLTGAYLEWFGGPWAHLYDVYFGTSPNPPLFAPDLALGPSTSSSVRQRYNLPALQAGTTYYWRIVSKTMANKTASSDIVRRFTTEGTAPPPPPPPPDGTVAADDIVIYAHTAQITGSAFQIVGDATAAGGARLYNINGSTGVTKISTALAAPSSYAELRFRADAGKSYRIWVRAKGDSNHYRNDSVHIQFSGSVNTSGAAAWRIGTTSSVDFNLEECSGCGLSGWGWEDNGWGGVNVLGPEIRFAQSGEQVIRIQPREDGVSIDQIVLSPSTYRTTRPGAAKNDTVILPRQDHLDGTAPPADEEPPPPPPPPPPDPTTPPDIVLYAGKATTFAGIWAPAQEPTAAGGVLMASANLGGSKVTTAAANPANYFELTFNAVKGVGYRLWIRGRALNNYWGNDSAHVQFSGTVAGADSTQAIYRIGTTSSTEYNLEDASGAGLSGWGWQDNGWGTGVLGPLIYFGTTGLQRIRIQTREDGLSIDQIVLSPQQYLSSAPGPLKNDTTILNEQQ